MKLARILYLVVSAAVLLGTTASWSENRQLPIPIRIVDSDIELDFTQLPGAPSVGETGPAPIVIPWDFGADGAGEYALSDQEGILVFDIRSFSGASTAATSPGDMFLEMEIPDVGQPTTTVVFRLLETEATNASTTARFRVANFYESEILGPAVKFPFDDFDLLISPNPINPIPGSTSLIAFAAGDQVKLHLTGFGSGFRLNGTGARLRYTISASALTGSSVDLPATPPPVRFHLVF